MNPSSGNLHPTEALLILPALPGITEAIFRYNSYQRAVEPRAEVPETVSQIWETGIIGQVLYLEAEPAGVRATGIGCFFDDPVHELMGLMDDVFQSLYHFTVGGPLDDARLATGAAYHDLKASVR